MPKIGMPNGARADKRTLNRKSREFKQFYDMFTYQSPYERIRKEMLL